MRLNMRPKRAGVIDASNGRIDITDPGYSANDTGMRMTAVSVAPAQYTCVVYAGATKQTGKRCWIAQITAMGQYEEASMLARANPARWESIGEISVHSGLAGFFIDKPDFTDSQWQAICNWMRGREVFCTALSDIGKNAECPVPFEGFWTASGLGDGRYPVYACYHEGAIIGLEIRFF